jgi:hypothetical protein
MQPEIASKIFNQNGTNRHGFESDIDRLRKANSFETFALPAFDKTEN